MTRKEFEATKWKMHKFDGLPVNPNADPECKTCDGYGIVDDGFVGCLLVNCPDCWKPRDIDAAREEK